MGCEIEDIVEGVRLLTFLAAFAPLSWGAMVVAQVDTWTLDIWTPSFVPPRQAACLMCSHVSIVHRG